MRTHFFSRLALLIGSGFLVVASQVWSGTTLEWIFIVGGAAMILLAGAGTAVKDRAQQGLDALLVLLGAFSVVQAIIFSGTTLEWFSFATGAAGALIATIGLLIHEASTERVVHELSVTTSAPRDREPLAH